MSEHTKDSEGSEYSVDFKHDQRFQSETIQQFDLLLDHAELNEFQLRLQKHEDFDKLQQQRHRLQQSIHEKESLIRFIQEALAKDQAELAAIDRESENLEKLDFYPIGCGFLDCATPERTPRDDCAASSGSKATSSWAQRSHGLIGMENTRHDLALVRGSKREEDVQAPSETMKPCILAYEGSCIRAWQRPPGAATSMPDLPMMSDKIQDAYDDEDCPPRDDCESVSSSMDLCRLAHRIRHELVGEAEEISGAHEGGQNHYSRARHLQFGRASMSMPDLPMMFDKHEDSKRHDECPPQHDRQNVSLGMDIACLAERIRYKSHGAVCTMPELPPMMSIDEELEADEEVPRLCPTSCRAAHQGLVGHEDKQSHSIRAWYRPPGAAITMPDLPMMSIALQNSNDEEECVNSEQSQEDIETPPFTPSQECTHPWHSEGSHEDCMSDKVLMDAGGELKERLSRLRQVLSVPFLSGSNLQLSCS